MVRTWARVLLALLGFSAVVTEAATLVERDRFQPVNFLSYFTVEGNLIAIVALLASATAVRRSRRLDLFRGASTVYMLTIFLVFAGLLSGLDGELTAVPWDNTVLHHLMPIAVAADWVLEPPRWRLPFRTALVWLALPAAYVVWTLLRGPIAHWYPYPFMNPAHGGYGQVALTCLGITVLVVALTWVATRFPLRSR
jgi:hypothetical protein